MVRQTLKSRETRSRTRMRTPLTPTQRERKRERASQRRKEAKLSVSYLLDDLGRRERECKRLKSRIRQLEVVQRELNERLQAEAREQQHDDDDCALASLEEADKSLPIDLSRLRHVYNVAFSADWRAIRLVVSI